MSGIIVSTEEDTNLRQDGMVEDIITRTMQRAAHSVLLVLLSTSGKWGRSVLVVYLLNLCSGMNIALFGPVYIHAVTHLKDDISIHNRDLCIHAAVHLNI